MQMATSGIANWFYQHGLQNAQSIATYMIWSGMSDFGTSVQRKNFEMMSRLTTNTPGVITTYIALSTMPTPRQPIPISCHAMFTDYSICFDIFPGS